MLREGLSPELAELLAQGPEIQRAALDRALARNRFDDPGAATLDGYVVALDSLAIDSAVWFDVSSGDKSKFRQMIDSANRGGAEGAESVQRDFLAKYVAHAGDLDGFWAAVIADVNLGQDVHDTYRWCLQVQAVCNGHQPLIDALQAKRNDGQDPINSFADLATIDVDGWKTLINGGIGVPDTIPQEWDESDRVQRYAETIARLVSDAVPTRVVHERIKRDSLELSGADDLDTFFTNNPSFDLRDQVFQRYLGDNPTALDTVPTTDGRRDACAENLKTIQRLGYVAPRGSTYDTIKPLYQAGIRSAADIDAMGPVAFVRRFAADFGAGELGKIRARAVYDRASHVYSITLALLSKYGPAFNKVGPSTVTEPPTVPASAPDLEALFGSMDFCGCEHCRSVFSPAAYMVDLLQFLRTQPGTSTDALSDLQVRRPDITKIDLSCANSSTPLPYIDLVNELLETRVSGGPAPSDDHWQTTWTAEELALRPEHRDDGAYTELVAAAYPWNLPFDFHRTESDIYLDELAVPRHAVLEAFNPTIDADSLARARLGLSHAMAAAITGGVGFSTLDSWNGKDAAALTSITVVLETSGQSFEELKTIIATEFVGRDLALSFAQFPNDCNLDDADVIADPAVPDSDFTDADLERWHRFVRLQRELDWTAYQLDAAIRAFAPTPTSLDTAFIQRLGAAQVIGERLGLEGLDLFGLWANIDTATPPEDPNAPSQYARLFLRRTVIDDPESSVFALQAGELATTAGAMDDDSRLTVTMAGLGASSVEITQLVEWLDDLAVPSVTTTTTVAILSAARRRITLARALGVSLSELRRLIAVTGFDPFHDDSSVVDMAGLQDAIDFLDAAQLVLDSEFSVAALDYILFHTASGKAGIEPDPAASLALLATLDAQLAAIAERYALVDDPTGTRLRDALSEYLPPSDPANLAADATRLDDLMAVILDTSNKLNVDQEGLIDTEMGEFLTSVSATQTALVGGGELTDRNARIGHVLERLLPWLEARARRAATIQTLSEGLGLAIEVGEQLLVEYMEGATSTPLVETFESGGNIDGNGDVVAASMTAFVRFYKAGALVLSHHFEAADLTYLYGPDAPVTPPWLHVNDLAASSPTSLTFQAWKRLAAVAHARARFPEHPDTLEVLRGLSSVGDVDGILAERGGWAAKDVSQIRIDLGFTSLTDFDDEAALLTILDALELVERTGVSASMLFSMATSEATPGEAEALRQSLRSRHGDASWATTGKALRDPLRERQRQALVAYLLANGDGSVSFASENDLYAHYLLDVEMSACATTSRIKLALSSIQLFIQRVFLNLEDPIQFDVDAAVQYRWMKNYRVWEANRKVFLYPENWVEPELRTDKSPLFAELEAALAQDDPSEKLTEKAFLGYLNGLESIAKPEVMGLVRERISGSGDALIDRLHVVARTRSEPHRWLYRTREDQRYWTPWVGLDADIEGDHVLPAVFNGRLYVLWPSFQIAGEEIAEVDPKADESVAGKGHVEIRLNWMERRFGEWSPVRMSPSFKTPESIHRWGLPGYRKRLRLSARTVTSTSSGRLALEIAVRYFSYARNAPDGKLRGLGRFVLEATDDAFVAQAVPPDGVITSWSFALNDHLVEGQAVVARSNASSKLQLAVAEDRWPGGNQTQTLFADPPRGYTLVFAQTDVPGIVRSTGFFYQDRWRSLFIEPRDNYQGKLGTLNVVDPANIDAAPFIEQAGLKIDLPVIDLEPKVIDLAPETLKFDDLEVKTPTYVGLAGVLKAESVSINPVADQQVVALASQEKDDATEVHDTEATPKALHTTVPWMGKRFRAYMFEHPYTDVFMGEIRAGGVEALLAPTEGQSVEGLARQQLTDTVLSEDRYDPKSFDNPLPEADIDFSVGGAYSVYNWELFFHAPVLLAKRLTNNQRFEEADSWLRKVFDPTASDETPPARYWRIKPFFESAQPSSIHELLLLLQYDGTDTQQLEARKAFEDQIWRWRRNPFEPHLIAGFRDGTYQRAVVMQYIDNLIAWGDSLFAQDTIESINEATQLYIMAQNILGPRPVMIDPHGEPEPKNFEELESGLDDFGNAIVELENYTLGSLAHSGLIEQDANSGLGTSINSARVPHSWYFCVPPNETLLGYWDTVEDRLTKIRNCQNLQGIERKLALFQPPLDPKALVSAAALSGNFGSALAAVSGRAPKHRFRVLLAKSLELAGEVRNLGNTLLRALESQDSAYLAQLRASQEPALLERVRANLELRLEHAEQALEALDAAKAIVWDRRAHYIQRTIGSHAIIGTGNVAGRSTEEQLQLYHLDQALAETAKALTWSQIQRFVSLVPNLQLGIQGAGSTPVLTGSFGGSQLASVMGAHASIHQQRSSIQSIEAQRTGLNAGYDRRLEEWEFQIANATKEIEHIETQKVATQTQVEIAKAELAAHDKRVADAGTIDAFMRSRYTNDQLYVWMAGQIKQVYKQAYNLAFRMALAAEQAYRFELQRNDSFIGYQYWDQAHSGLLAGDLLVHDLRRMDAAYIDNYEREYELTKVVSLAQVDPYALSTLRQTGGCYFTVPEWVYDLDHPGHIRRRIKSVSIAMPAVAGPHVGGGCTLTLESSKMRVQTGDATYGGYAEDPEDPDSRFVYRYGQVERIATSSGRDSTGMFEPALDGPRYMPFEGAGAISTWRVNLPTDFRQFDYESIGDVLLTIRYTAREGGSAQADAALQSLDSVSALHSYGSQPSATGAAMMLRASVDFADAWYAFLREEHGGDTRTFTMELDASRFPHAFAKRDNLEISSIRMILATSAPAAMDANLIVPSDGLPDAANFSTNANVLDGQMVAAWDGAANESPGTFTLSVDETAIPVGLAVDYDGGAHTRFDETKVRELVVVVFFEDSTT